MEHVLEVAHRMFWEAGVARLPLAVPNPPASGSSPTLPQLAAMNGKERKAAFRAAGFTPKEDLILLRALQHVTSLHGTEWLDPDVKTFGDGAGGCVHRHLSAQHWSLYGSGLRYASLLGMPLCLSTESSVASPVAPSDAAAPVVEGCVGLLNQGSTCYLNSLLQALFHLTEFRSVIYRMLTTNDAADGKIIPFAMQRLFCLLQTSKVAQSTKHLTTSFGWTGSEAFIQHDIHELTRILLDNLEEKLNKTGQENAIKRLFCGIQENYISVSDISYCGTRDEEFYDLQLVVKGTSDIYKSLDSLVQPEILDGRNKYCLERDGAKSYHRAEKGIRIKSFPPVTILHLTRFDFDVAKGDMSKVLSRWDYYDQLDLSPYLPKEAGRDLAAYRLHSVLVHSGADAKFGHYYSFVRVGQQWMKFNDEIVSAATSYDTFGANFGGNKMNYWGTEVPLSTNAYMLVYVRESMLNKLVRQINVDELPAHLVAHIQKENEEQLLRDKEKTEDHLYAKVHFVTLQDCQENPVLLHVHCPRLRYDPQRTMRVALTSCLVEGCSKFIESFSGIPAALQMLWCVQARQTGSHAFRMQTPITQATRVQTICQNGEYSHNKECCVLVLSSNDTPLVTGQDIAEATSPDQQAAMILTHHKYYDPFKLSVSYIGPVAALGSAEDIRTCIDGLVSKRLIDDKLTVNDDPSPSFSVCLEEPGGVYIPATADSHPPASGDIFVWQQRIEKHDDVMYSTVEAFQHFLKHRVPVAFHAMTPPYALIHSTQLAYDISHANIQKYVARIIGESVPGKIRFARQNPDTRLPFFAKIKTDVGNLREMLTVNGELGSIIYLEVCKYTLNEIEQSNSLQFDFFSQSVKSASSHWILMSRAGTFSALELMQRCAIDISSHQSSGDRSPPQQQPQAATSPSRAAESLSPAASSSQLDETVVTQWDPTELRLVDVWKGRIYNVYTSTSDLGTKPFEESAEYRVEFRPKPLPGVTLANQCLVNFHHFSRGVGKLNCHGDPFSLFVDLSWCYPDLIACISRKLKMSEESTLDWNPFLCRGQVSQKLATDVLLEHQLFSFAERAAFLPNQRDHNLMAFIGLEHSPLPGARRAPRREERSLKIYN